MRVMVIVKATERSEAGILPGDPRAPKGYDDLFEQMTSFNEELVKAGVLLAGEGLRPSDQGKRLHFSGSTKRILDGPFAETKELVAGFWLWEVKSMDEAVAWAQRIPNPMPDEDSIVEIRPVYDTEDFADALTPDVRAREDRIRTQLERQQSR